MAWLAANKNGIEYVSENKPNRNCYYWECGYEVIDEMDRTIEIVNILVCLPKGSIFKLIGRDLTWEDEPVEI